MTFNVGADAYMRFMGPYSEPLAARFADLAGVRQGQRVLDVGCGPGALTAELVSRVGAHAVSAVEPSASFAAAVRERLPGVDVRPAAAERLPFPDDVVDAAMAQLVVHFMADPVTGLREMGRVSTLTVRVRHADFDRWWEPFTLGVGPAGAYVTSLAPDRRAALRDQCRHLLPGGPIEISATAWAATGRA